MEAQRCDRHVHGVGVLELFITAATMGAIMQCDPRRISKRVITWVPACVFLMALAYSSGASVAQVPKEGKGKLCQKETVFQGKGSGVVTLVQGVLADSTVLWIRKEGGKVCLMKNALPGPPVTGIGDLAISPQLDGFAYVVKSDKGVAVYRNDEQRGEFDDFQAYSLKFSDEGSAFAFVMKKADKWHVVVNNDVSPGYDDVDELSAPDKAGHIAYVATVGGKDALYIDHKKVREIEGFVSGLRLVDGIGTCAYSLSHVKGNILAHDIYVGSKKVASFVEYIGTDLMPRVSPFAEVSGDGKHFAYCLRDNRPGKESSFVVDGEALPGMRPEPWALFMLGQSPIAFMKDNRHVMLRLSNGVTVWPGGMTVPFESCYDPVEVPDGSSSVAYAAISGKQREKLFMVVAGKAGPEYDSVLGPAFDSSGRNTFYLARSGTSVHLIHEGAANLILQIPVKEVFASHHVDFPRGWFFYRNADSNEEGIVGAVLWPPVVNAKLGTLTLVVQCLKDSNLELARVVYHYLK